MSLGKFELKTHCNLFICWLQHFKFYKSCLWFAYQIHNDKLSNHTNCSSHAHKMALKYHYLTTLEKLIFFFTKIEWNQIEPPELQIPHLNLSIAFYIYLCQNLRKEKKLKATIITAYFLNFDIFLKFCARKKVKFIAKYNLQLFLFSV